MSKYRYEDCVCTFNGYVNVSKYWYEHHVCALLMGMCV